MKAKLTRNLYKYVNDEQILTWKKGTEIETLHQEPKTDVYGNELCYYSRMPNGEIEEIRLHQLAFIEDNDSSDIDWEQRRYELAKIFAPAEFAALVRTGSEINRSEIAKESINMADEIIKQLKG